MLLVKLLILSSIVKIGTGQLLVDQSNGHLLDHVATNPNDHGLLGRHRSLATDAEKKLQQQFINWNFCTNAFTNFGFTPMNSFVPDNTVFLSAFNTSRIDSNPNTCKAKTITRTATINTGQQTVFFALVNLAVLDYSDDWKNGTCGSQFPNETLAIRLRDGSQQSNLFNDPIRMEKLYVVIDGEAKTPFYLYDDTEFYLSACDDGRTTQEYSILSGTPEGDLCDVEPYQSYDGLDSYPNMGWYGIDVRTWADGESHTYEFGDLQKCFTTKYILTAKADPDPPCGLFGRGIFCPIKWFFDLFT